MDQDFLPVQAVSDTDGAESVGLMKFGETAQKAKPAFLESEAGQNGRGPAWGSLALLAVLVAAGLIAFEWLKHYLFPHFTSLQHQGMTICAGTLAAVFGSYYATRKLERAISLHAQAKKKLALERNVLRTVTDNVPDSIFAKDAEGRYLFANKAFAKLHGVGSPDDLLGKTAFDLFPKEKASELHAVDLEVMKSRGTIIESERTAVDAEGKVKWLRTTKVPLVDTNDHLVGIVGLHRDITQRREAEQKLRQSEANLAAAQRIARFGSVELDLLHLNEPEKFPMRWSDEVFRIFGYGPGGVEMSRQTFFSLVHPEERERVLKALTSAIQKAEPYTLDFRIIRADGAVRNIHERGDFIFDADMQAPLKMVGSIQDVTDRVEAEARLQRANQELAERVQELQQRTTEITLLSELGSRLQACQSAEESYVEISIAAEQLFPGWSGGLCAISASRTVVETVANWGKPAQGERVFAPDECWALRLGRPQWFRSEERWAPCRHLDLTDVTESLCVPLMSQGDALGILSLQKIRAQGEQESAARSSGEAERRLAAVLAEQIGLALGNLRLRETLRNQSICDPLTGLFNRRYMEESLEREFSRANRKKSRVAIIMMDIDHFKRFNDTHGHQAGDALLRSLGELLKKSTRGQDIACRYGGEEFVIVLCDTSLEGALQRAEILRQQVKQMYVEHATQLLGTTSISMGVALYPDHGATMGDVMKAADQALYSAKREGRDRVAAWSAESVR